MPTPEDFTLTLRMLMAMRTEIETAGQAVENARLLFNMLAKEYEVSQIEPPHMEAA